MSVSYVRSQTISRVSRRGRTISVSAATVSPGVEIWKSVGSWGLFFVLWDLPDGIRRFLPCGIGGTMDVSSSSGGRGLGMR